MSLTLIIGIGIFTVMVMIALAIMQIQDPVLNVIYKGLSIIVILVGLFLVAKATYDVKDHCEMVLNISNEEYFYGDNYTTKHWIYDSAEPTPADTTINLFVKNTTNIYDWYCEPNTESTNQSFYLLATWFIRVIAGFTVLALGYLGLKKLQEIIPRFGGKR